jgi:glycosyltransferase involved in cell wall biosynthesis
MKIFHVILSLAGGGAERQLAFIASGLRIRGHGVHVGFVYPGVNGDRIDSAGCTLHQLTTPGRRNPLLVLELLTLMRRLRPDVVQTWLAHMDILGGVAARLLRLPWVMSERSGALNYPPTLMNHIRIAAGRRADLIMPNSTGGADYWRAHGIGSDRIEIVPNYVPLAEIETAGSLTDERVSADDELVVYVGRLSPEKNLDSLIDAFVHVLRQRPRARFAFCGDGPLLADLKAYVDAAGLRERFIFAGFVTNVASWLKRADASVAVSRWEGHPNAVLEAMAAGVPLIVSDIPAYRSILDNESAAFVPAADTRAIAAAVVTTLADRGTAERRAARARSMIGSLSLDATAARYESVYRRAIAIAASRRGRSSVRSIPS